LGRFAILTPLMEYLTYNYDKKVVTIGTQQ
jgi:hypothetical protein